MAKTVWIDILQVILHLPQAHGVSQSGTAGIVLQAQKETLARLSLGHLPIRKDFLGFHGN